MAEGHGRLGKRVRGPNFVYRRSKKQQEKRDKEEKEESSIFRDTRSVGKDHVMTKKDWFADYVRGPILSDKKLAAKYKRKSERKVGKGYVISKNRSKKK
jgi:hypothetical protein